MFVMDVLGLGEPSKAHVLVNGIERKWGSKTTGLKVLRRETGFRVIASNADVFAAIQAWVVVHQNFGNEAQLHTFKRPDAIFPMMNWGTDAAA